MSSARSLLPRMRRTCVTAAIVWLGAAAAARACSVCYGDPESDMAQGALWGVVVLGLIIYGVLLGMVGVGITWFIKARRLPACVGPADGTGALDPLGPA